MRSPDKMFATGILLVVACLAFAGAIAFSREPFINANQGDLLLFVFALGGGISGFLAGYGLRKRMTEKNGRKEAAKLNF